MKLSDISTALTLISFILSVMALSKARKAEQRAKEIQEDTKNLIENAQLLDKYQEL